MLSYRHVATYLGNKIPFVTSITDMKSFQTPDGYALYTVTQLGGGIAAYRFTAADQPIQLLSSRAYGPGMSYLDKPSAALVTLGEKTLVFGAGLTNALGTGFRLGGDGALGESQALSAGLGADVTLLGSFETPLGDFLYSARNNRTAFDTWRVNEDGSISHVALAALPWIPGAQGTEINDMEVVAVGDRNFMLSASALGNYVAIQAIAGNGAIGRAQVLWSDRGDGLAAPTHIGTVTVAGVTYLIVGSSQSSSLTTMRIGYDGALQPVDHIVDELTTRFSGATALETVMLDGRAFVFVGGHDDGISVFTVMPNGRLLFLATLADTNDRTLADVSAISAVAIDGSIALFVSSRTERGLTHLVFDPGQIGDTRTVEAGSVTGTAGSDLLRAGTGTTAIRGGDGNDILISGSDPVELHGGDGADLFVIMPVGGEVVIGDFQLGIDRLDLSNLGMIRSTMQLSWRWQWDGIKILFGDTVLVIRTRDGVTLQASDFTNSLFPVAHYQPPEMPGNLIGTEANDTLSAGGAGSYIYGLAGHDMLTGGGGNDTVTGGWGDDTLVGGAGHDRLMGDMGHDLMRGGEGNDEILGGDGMDTIHGGAGNDRIFGQAGNDVIYGDDGDDHIEDWAGLNQIWGGAGNDAIASGAGHDRIAGDAGRDTIWGGAGNDQIWGGTGDDSLIGGLGNDTLYGSSENDFLDGGDGNDLLDGGYGSDTIWGGKGNDRLLGGVGPDRLFGGIGLDTMWGMIGNDQLFGGLGDDRMFGGDGNDLLRGEAGNDALAGDAGNDLLFGGLGNDTLYGNADNDRLYGEAGNDLLFGGYGNDSLWGHDGNDTLHGQVGADQMVGGAGHDLLLGQDGYDRIWGGLDNDRLEGGNGNDLLMGEAGNDLLFGGMHNDTLNGGPDHDRLFGGDGNDLLLGQDGDDIMAGENGNDTLRGGAGSDQMLGGNGNDVLSGELGNDRIQGGNGNDWILGGLGDDLLHGNQGSDSISGGFGDDTIHGGSENVLLYGDQGDDQLDGGMGWDTLNGGIGNDRLTDLMGNNRMLGGAGNDTLIAGGGNDTLEGGMGHDLMTGGAGADVFLFSAALVLDGSIDRITDFGNGNDRIDLRGLNLSFVGDAAFSAAGQVRSWSGASGGMVAIDLNGDGNADLTIALGAHGAADAGDFLL